MGKEVKKENPHKIGLGKMLLWQANGASVAIQVVLLSALQLYCTNALGLSAGLVGALLMGSKIVDAVTDLCAGYIVDRTNTKIGRGRPYDLCVIGLWFTTWLLFSVPESLSLVVKCIWIVVCYALTQSVFRTFLGAAGTVYMVRAFNDEQKYVKLNSIGGLIVTFCVVIFNVIMPGLQAKVLSSAPGWSRLVACIAIPLAILGMMRFFFIEEKYDVDGGESEQIKIKDIITLFKTNKNIYSVCFLRFVAALGGGISVSSYYFLYVVKNLELLGIMSFFSILPMITMLLYPVLMKKLSVVKLIQMACLLTLISGPLTFIAKDNMVLLIIGGFFAGAATLPISYMYGLLIIDCADYNEWQGRPRMEGTMGAVTGFADKVGSAFSSFLGGILLTLAGFDGTLTVQSDSVVLMIRFLNAFIPTIFMVLASLTLHFYKLDKLKPQITKELTEIREKRAAEAK